MECHILGFNYVNIVLQNYYNFCLFEFGNNAMLVCFSKHRFPFECCYPQHLNHKPSIWFVPITMRFICEHGDLYEFGSEQLFKLVNLWNVELIIILLHSWKRYIPTLWFFFWNKVHIPGRNILRQQHQPPKSKQINNCQCFNTSNIGKWHHNFHNNTGWAI